MGFQQDVEAHHKLTYQNNVMMVAQQMRNPLRMAVTTVMVTGEASRVSDLLAKKKAVKGQDYGRNNPDNRTKKDARWLVRPEVLHDGELIDTIDKWDAAMDPTSYLMQNSVAAVERAVFDAILGIEEDSAGNFAIAGSGIFGVATSGKRPSTTTGLPAGNFIAHGGTGLTLDKLRAARKAMKKAEFGIEDNDPLWACITPDQEDDLIGLAAASGPALNAFNIEQLRTGKPTPLLGINWILTNRLPVNATGQRLIPIWSKKNVVAGFWQDVEGRIWNDTSKQNLPYIYTSAYVDCVRIQDGGVRVIECA